MTTDARVDEVAGGQVNVLARSVCFTLRCSFLGNDRKFDLKSYIESTGGVVTVDDEQVRGAMKLIDTKEIAPLRKIQGRAKSYLRSRAIPAHRVFGESSYLIALPLVEEVHTTLQAFRNELRAAAHTLAHDRYAAAVIKQQVALGSLFQAKHYKTPDEVEQAFDLDWFYVSFESPENLTTVSAAIADESRRRFQSQVQAMYDEVVYTLRSDALTIVQALERRLTPGADGSAPVIRRTALRDLADYVANLPVRNLADDQALPDALASLTRVADGLTPDVLRDSAATRDALRAAAARTADVLRGLVSEVAGGRSIALPGDDFEG